MLNKIAVSYQRLVLALLTVCVISACGSYSPKDSAPSVKVDPSTIKDAIPRQDMITRAGNKNPYTVLGKTYRLLPSSKGYSEQGLASWYGTKFHGRPTANGEPYSLYGMTAAHKTLPIPAYVKVTNLANGRTAIVRVNDRGPFHDDRIIDLSYAAAVKLGYAELGTARVLVEVIDPTPPAAVVAKPAADSDPDGVDKYFLQVGAFKSLESANNLRARLALATRKTVSIKTSEPVGFYRVQLGPLLTMNEVLQTSERLIELDIEPRLITE